MSAMTTFNDFCEWIGSQKAAAAALGLTPSRVSRYCTGRTRIPVEVAEACEAYSHGKFKKERLVWPTGEAGQANNDS